MKPCVLCMNGTNHKPQGGGIPAHLLHEYAVSIAKPHLAKFKLHTNASLIAAMNRLKVYSTTLGAAAFEEKQKTYGLTWNPHNLMLNARIQLPVVSILMYDWPHCYLCDGLADAECGLFLKHMHTRSATGYKELAIYQASWKAPQGLPPKERLFSASSIRNNLKSGGFSCTASEFLTLTPSLILYLTRVASVRGEFLSHVQSMVAVLEVVEILQAVRRGIVTPAELDAAIIRHLELFRSVYGDDHCRPKHHWVIHLPTGLSVHDMLLGTLVNERKHRLVRRYTMGRKNTQSFEMGVVEELTVHHLHDLEKFGRRFEGHAPGPRILDALKEIMPDCTNSEWLVSKSAMSGNGVISAGDVVLLSGKAAGKLLLIFSTGGEAKVVVSVWRSIGSPADPRVSGYQVIDNVCIFPLASIECAVHYRMSDDGNECSIYLPWEYRR